MEIKRVVVGAAIYRCARLGETGFGDHGRWIFREDRISVIGVKNWQSCLWRRIGCGHVSGNGTAKYVT